MSTEIKKKKETLATSLELYKEILPSMLNYSRINLSIHLLYYAGIIAIALVIGFVPGFEAVYEKVLGILGATSGLVIDFKVAKEKVYRFIVTDRTIIKNSLTLLKNEGNNAGDDIDKINGVITLLAGLIKVASQKPNEFLPMVRGID